jgi:phosphoadenosine phosphosulfate reductase
MRLSEEQIAEALGPGLFGETCVTRAIAALRMYEPPEGYRVSFSGGKDSEVLLQLVKEAGVKHEAHYHWTTCDPPELVYFIRQNYPEVTIDRPKKTMWQLIERRGLPTRFRRWCCAELKERNGRGWFVATGVRASESVKRAARARSIGGYVEVCRRDTSQRFIHPIIDWTEEQVWAFIQQRDLPYCSLYDEGFKRIGCVLCPMTMPDNMARHMARWPKMFEAARRASARFYESHKDRAGRQWASADAMWAWWLGQEEISDDDQECIGLFSAGMEG